jgi:NDP-sugar pyrophosphorylase family protein
MSAVERQNGVVRRNGHAPPTGMKAVILAGGRGTRLAPYTSVLPKPLMPIGERSILETVVDQLAGHGFTDLTFCVGYLSHLIRAVFDTRTSNGVSITYVHEDTAMGTAAPLRLVDGLDDSFILMNGDVLTTLDYGDLVEHHQQSGNLLTVATHKRRIKIDYGVVHVDGSNGSRTISGWEEKPEVVSHVSMGIYVVEPEAIGYIPDGYFDFPDLVRMLLAAGERIGAYEFSGLWFDIGRHDDYASAVATWMENGSGNGNGNGHHGNANGHQSANGNGNGHPDTARTPASAD